MSLIGQAYERSANLSATARYDRESAGQDGLENLTQIARQFRLAMIFKIPVGYQDEKGFHRGEPQLQKPTPESGSGVEKTVTYQF